MVWFYFFDDFNEIWRNMLNLFRFLTWGHILHWYLRPDPFDIDDKWLWWLIVLVWLLWLLLVNLNGWAKLFKICPTDAVVVAVVVEDDDDGGGDNENDDVDDNDDVDWFSWFAVEANPSTRPRLFWWGWLGSLWWWWANGLLRFKIWFYEDESIPLLFVISCLPRFAWNGLVLLNKGEIFR